MVLFSRYFTRYFPFSAQFSNLVWTNSENCRKVIGIVIRFLSNTLCYVILTDNANGAGILLAQISLANFAIPFIFHLLPECPQRPNVTSMREANQAIVSGVTCPQ